MNLLKSDNSCAPNRPHYTSRVWIMNDLIINKNQKPKLNILCEGDVS